MKAHIILLACVGVLSLGSTSAVAGTRVRDHSKDYSKTPVQPAPDLCGPWFSSISAGVWWVEDYGVNVPFVGVAGDHTVSFDTGFQINVVPIGYRFSDMFSASLETGFFQADVASVTLPLGLGTFDASGGQLRLFPTTVNATLTVPITNRLNFYVGVGAGVLYRELRASIPAVALAMNYHDSGWNALVQARAGVSFEVARCQFVNIGYRYQHVFAKPDDIQGHSLEAGYTVVW